MKSAINIEILRYPIGKFIVPSAVNASVREVWIQKIENLPKLVSKAVNPLTKEQLVQVYRPGGWTILQLINHLLDSHSNAVIRFKLALTEDLPVIKPYAEQAWALLADTENCPVDLTLNMLTNLHKRWVILLHSLNEQDWQRKFFHPESNREFTLQETLGMYVWHGEHHLAHIELAIKNERPI